VNNIINNNNPICKNRIRTLGRGGVILDISSIKGTPMANTIQYFLAKNTIT